MLISDILKTALEKDASDIIISSWAKPSLKIYWDIVYLDDYEEFSHNTLSWELFSIMNEKQRNMLRDNLELDFSIDLKWYTRFRVNVFYTKNWVWVVFRPIKRELPSFEDLMLPKQLVKFVKKKNWLILVTGSVWSWKSTTMSTMLEIINNNMSKHIITVEDPIEYIFNSNKSLIEQREVWLNTKSFENGLKYALRQASDVIMIWEMRDLETFRLALRAAETWNLVIATLHTSWAARTIARIIDMFPWDEKDHIRSQLADSLVWIIWQDLIKTKKWKSRVLASELLVNNTSIKNMIRKWALHQIDWAIETGKADWMYTMQSNLEELREKWLID